LTRAVDLAYFSAAMSSRRIRVFFTLALASSSAASFAQAVLPSVDGVTTERPTSLVVLRNGEVLAGQIQAAKNDRVTVRMPRGEISLRQAEVDVIAGSLDDAYALKLAKISPPDVDGHLDLAAWCLRHELFGSAATELTTAMSIQPRHPRIAMIQRRLRQAVDQQQTTQETEPNAEVETRTAKSHFDKPPEKPDETAKRPVDESSVWPPRIANTVASEKDAVPGTSRREPTGQNKMATNATSKRAPPRDTITEIERLVRTLPSEAVESFTNVAQPILVNGCATTGCHAPGNTTTFTLLRLPLNRPVSRRLTQRNLYNVVQVIDFKYPANSTLFKMAKEPHGPLKTPALGETHSPAFRELVQWAAVLTRSNLDELLPVEPVEQKQAMAETRPPAGSARQSLIRRMRGPTVSSSRTPRAHVAQPATDEPGLIVAAPPANAPTNREADPQANALAGHVEHLAPTPTNINQAGLIVGAPPPSTPVTSAPAAPQPTNSLMPPNAIPSTPLTAQLGTAPTSPQSARIRTPNPNGTTAVDRFLALQGAPRVAKEIQSAKQALPSGRGAVKQQPPPTEPDPYDLMRFVKEK
jgi:hypothetical protein